MSPAVVSRRGVRIAARRGVAPIALALALALARPAAADSAIPPPPANGGNPKPEELTRARKVFDAGGRAFEQGAYDNAIQAFLEAYALTGRKTVFFSLAQAYRKRFVKLGAASDRLAAIELYRAYLVFLDESKTQGRRGDAEKGLESLDPNSVAAGPAPGPSPTPTPASPKKTQLAINSPTPDARVSIDGKPPVPPQMIEVTPGPHTVRVSAPGHITKEFTTEAYEGQINAETYELEEQPTKLTIRMPSRANLFLDGRDLGASSQLDVRAGTHFVSVTQSGHHSVGKTFEAEPGKPQTLTFDLTSTTQRDGSIGLMAAGGVTLTGGAVLLGLAFLRQAEAQAIEEERQRGSISQAQRVAYEDARRDRDVLRAAGVTVGGAGGLGLAIGAALYLFDVSPPVQPPLEGPKQKKTEDAPSTEMDVMFVPRLGPARGAEGFELGGTWLGTF